jgi:sugar phosphate permease
VWWFGVGFAAIALAVYALVVSAPPDRVRAVAPRARQKTTASTPWGQGLRNLRVWMLGLAFGALAFSLLGYNTWAPTFLTEVLAIPPATASFYASLLFLVGIPGNVVAGWAINRARHRYLLLVGAFVISGLLYAWSFRLGREAVVAPYMAALGFVSNFIPTAIFALAPETMARPDLAGLSLAIMSVGSNAGVLLGPPVLGAVVDGTGWTTGSLVLLIVMAFGTIASMLTWRMTER